MRSIVALLLLGTTVGAILAAGTVAARPSGCVGPWGASVGPAGGGSVDAGVAAVAAPSTGPGSAALERACAWAEKGSDSVLVGLCGPVVAFATPRVDTHAGPAAESRADRVDPVGCFEVNLET